MLCKYKDLYVGCIVRLIPGDHVNSEMMKFGNQCGWIFEVVNNSHFGFIVQALDGTIWPNVGRELSLTPEYYSYDIDGFDKFELNEELFKI